MAFDLSLQGREPPGHILRAVCKRNGGSVGIFPEDFAAVFNEEYTALYLGQLFDGIESEILSIVLRFMMIAYFSAKVQSKNEGGKDRRKSLPHGKLLQNETSQNM